MLQSRRIKPSGLLGIATMTLLQKDALASKQHYHYAARIVHDDPQRIAFEILHGIRREELQKAHRVRLPDVSPENAIFVVSSNAWHVRLARRIKAVLGLPWRALKHNKKQVRQRAEMIG
ncbi:hypothetical protein [Limoniibacter endophyticus]|uniref:hypothetical protein n=1 Tax=Limoniibacter endophyticus TaxID=1565040 RepID=UPI00167739CA|nr:hypothetical protein [Limoniibacter endophyticus]